MRALVKGTRVTKEQAARHTMGKDESKMVKQAAPAEKMRTRKKGHKKGM